MERLAMLLSTSLIFSSVLVAYWDIWRIFFQQDEWFWFKKIIFFDNGGIQNHFTLVSNHFVPLFSLQFDLLFRLFGFDQYYYGLYNITLHSLNGVLLYVFSSRYTGNKLIALVTSIIFVTFSTPHQAVTWYGTSPMSLPSTLLGLSSLILCHYYVNTGKEKYILGSIVSILIGLFFYENLLAMFVFLPIWVFIEKKEYFKKTAILSIFSGLLYFMVRSQIQITDGITIKTSLFEYLINTLENVITFPLVGYSQLFVPAVAIYQLAVFIVSSGILLFNTSLMARFPIGDIAFISNAIWSVLTLGLMYALIKFGNASAISRRNKKILLSMSIFSLVNILPFALLPSSYLESRHFYLASIGSAVILGSLTIQHINRIRLNLNKLAISTLLLMYICINIAYNRYIISGELIKSDARKVITTQILDRYREIPSKTIFFSESGNLPFQSGVGEMLMVLYHSKQPYHRFFDSEFLTHMGSEGYDEKNDIGFGYFYSSDKFNESYQKYRLNPENVFSFYWDDKKFMLIDSTSTFREKLKLENE